MPAGPRPQTVISLVFPGFSAGKGKGDTSTKKKSGMAKEDEYPKGEERARQRAARRAERETKQQQTDESAERKMDEASAKGGLSPDDIDETTGEPAADRQDRPGASGHFQKDEEATGERGKRAA